MKNSNAIQGALKRIENRPSNNLPIRAYQAREKSVVDWNNWPDWNDGPDFTDWQNTGGLPPK